MSLALKAETNKTCRGLCGRWSSLVNVGPGPFKVLTGHQRGSISAPCFKLSRNIWCYYHKTRHSRNPYHPHHLLCHPLFCHPHHVCKHRRSPGIASGITNVCITLKLKQCEGMWRWLGFLKCHTWWVTRNFPKLLPGSSVLCLFLFSQLRNEEAELYLTKLWNISLLGHVLF